MNLQRRKNTNILQIQTHTSGIIGHNLIVLPQTTSTNDYAKELLSKCEPFSEGTVILAVRQTHGRGQFNTSWYSEPYKNLTFSVILNPDFLPVLSQFYLVMAFSLALKDAISRVLPYEIVQIKWPNDLYLNGKKCGGMLVENVLQGKKWKHAILGIGLNVNQITFTEEIRERVTSLAMVLGKEMELNTVFQILCEEFNRYYVALKHSDHHALGILKNQYLSVLFGFQEERIFYVSGSARQGKIIGITKYGKLIVDFKSEIIEFGLKEIQF